MPCRTRMRPPRFRTKDVSTCMGSPTARGSSIRKPFARGGCCLLVSELDRHLGIRPVSQLDTQPVVSPVNASRLPSRAETSCITRGRGGWLGLTPWKTCTSYPLPAFLAHSPLGHCRPRPRTLPRGPLPLRPGSRRRVRVLLSVALGQFRTCRPKQAQATFYLLVDDFDRADAEETSES